MLSTKEQDNPGWGGGVFLGIETYFLDHISDIMLYHGWKKVDMAGGLAEFSVQHVPELVFS